MKAFLCQSTQLQPFLNQANKVENFSFVQWVSGAVKWLTVVTRSHRTVFLTNSLFGFFVFQVCVSGTNLDSLWRCPSSQLRVLFSAGGGEESSSRGDLITAFFLCIFACCGRALRASVCVCVYVWVWVCFLTWRLWSVASYDDFPTLGSCQAAQWVALLLLFSVTCSK